MIKSCNIKVNNEAITVIEFDGKLVQIPSIHNKSVDKIDVLFENGRYTVVDDIYSEIENKSVRKTTTKIRKKNNNKKTTLDEYVNNEENIENKESDKKE